MTTQPRVRGISRKKRLKLAARYVWWQEPSATLKTPRVLLRQILRLGTEDDYVAARRFWGEAAFKRALVDAPPGALDKRSWVFWHRHFKLFFFGSLKIGRVGEPEHLDKGPWIASPLDLLATKLKALHDRVEARDYRDIEVLLRKGGLTLDRGIAAAHTLFGATLNPLDTAKAVAWFEDGNLTQKLSARTRRYLERAAGEFRPGTKAAQIKSRALSPRA